MENQKSNVVNLMMYKALSRCVPKPTMRYIDAQPDLAQVVYLHPSLSAWTDQVLKLQPAIETT